MPTLDSCVNAIFEPGNIGSGTGEVPTTIRPGTLYTPGSYPPDGVEYTLNFSRFYNSMYYHQGLE